MSNVSESMEFKRLKWHCRRGMLELDLLLEPFLEDEFETLSDEEKRCFYKLIECEDQDIFVWFMQKEVPTDPELALIVKLILDRVQPENYKA